MSSLRILCVRGESFASFLAVPGLCVFVDIGGNRELEALVALLPWVATALPCVPRFIAVKSETLYAAVRRNRERREERNRESCV